MFDETASRVALGGKSGPVDISDFIDLVDRNRRATSINWHRDTGSGPLGHLCTIVIGNPDNGDARNVATPTIPEFTQTVNGEWIVARGWRMLLTLFLEAGWIYPTAEIHRWLGPPTFDYARSISPCR